MASVKCPNCGASLSCGCQRRTASNGASVCSICLAHYETTLKSKNLKPVPAQPILPGSTDPSNVQINVTQRIEYL